MAEREFQELNARLDRLEQLMLLNGKEVLTIDELTAYTGYKKSHIYRLTSQKAIPYYKPQGGTLYFKKSEIENWLLQNRQATTSEIEAKAATRIAIRRLNKQLV